MLGTIFLVFIVALLAAIIGAWAALQMQAKYRHNTFFVSEDWARRQEKRIADIEMRFSAQVQQLLSAWQVWESKDDLRYTDLKHQYESYQSQIAIERELAHLTLIEETPLSLIFEDQNGRSSTSWQPAKLEGADLSNRDLSHRFLRRANLRNARLINTNFFMADLSNANLSGANLSGADLSGANLKGADLRNTILTAANLRVADLQNALLANANVQDAHNFTAAQLQSAQHPAPVQNHTAIDSSFTTPRMPSLPAQDPGINEQQDSIPTFEDQVGEYNEALDFPQLEQPTLPHAALTPSIAEAESNLSEDEEVHDAEVTETMPSNGFADPSLASVEVVFDDLPVTPAPSATPLPVEIEEAELVAETQPETATYEEHGEVEFTTDTQPESATDAKPAPAQTQQQTEPMRQVTHITKATNSNSMQRKKKQSGNMRARR